MPLCRRLPALCSVVMCRLCNEGAITTNIGAGHLLWCCCHLSALHGYLSHDLVSAVGNELQCRRCHTTCSIKRKLVPWPEWHTHAEWQGVPLRWAQSAVRVQKLKTIFGGSDCMCLVLEVIFLQVTYPLVLARVRKMAANWRKYDARPVKRFGLSAEDRRLPVTPTCASLFVAVGNDTRAGVHLFQSCLLSTCCHLVRQTSTGWRSGNSLQVPGWNPGRVTRYPDGRMDGLLCFPQAHEVHTAQHFYRIHPNP